MSGWQPAALARIERRLFAEMEQVARTADKETTDMQIRICNWKRADGTPCGAHFVQHRHTITGRLAPINTQASIDGNIGLNLDGSYFIITKAEEWDGPRYKNHWATCMGEDAVVKRTPVKPKADQAPHL